MDFNINNKAKLSLLFIITLISIAIYQFILVDMNYFDYAMSIRLPKILAMTIAAFCIGTASIVFQSIINNNIVTPCLLGMNSLYSLIHTGIVFILGSTSILVINKNFSFAIDLVVMAIIATLIYGYLFKKTNYNVLYILLMGTIMATLFSSITNSMIRVIDPNEYAKLQDSLIAGFSNVNGDILAISFILIAFIVLMLRKEIALLDVITLGKNQAINLGVNYDRTVTKLLIGVTLFIAIATALVGPISFLGLLIANISRQLFKTHRHSYLMLGSAFLGIIILLLGQALIEHVFTYSTTIAVFINIFGGIYFLYLILKNNGGK